jgi:adenine-specific DNA-methyltransferase
MLGPAMIKYLGSKRRLVAELGRLLDATGARTTLDLFTGTTRVAQEFCRRGAQVTCVDTAAYSEVLAQCYVELDAATVDPAEVAEALARLAALPDRRGYVTEVFCERSRYFHPDNGLRIDAIRDGIDELYGDSWLRPVLLTSLLEAADRVDSTVGMQMAYLKQWAPRALRPLRLEVPVLTPGTGRAVRGDVLDVCPGLDAVDLAYLDPPYNQHRYFTNYHVWETLVRWDAPEHYGVACKRADARDEATRSPFNSRRTMPDALAGLIAGVRAETVVVSFSNEGFVPLAGLVEMCEQRGRPVRVLAYDTRRYIGQRLGVFNPAGQRVGVPGPERNTEYLLVSAPDEVLAAIALSAPPTDTSAVTGEAEVTGR